MNRLYQILQIFNQKTFFQISFKIIETFYLPGKPICFVAAHLQYMNTASYAAPRISTRESSRFIKNNLFSTKITTGLRETGQVLSKADGSVREAIAPLPDPSPSAIRL
jgi:hypothetical protein